MTEQTPLKCEHCQAKVATEIALDLVAIKERAAVIAAMRRPMAISRLGEAFAWANADRDALVDEVERLRAAMEPVAAIYHYSWSSKPDTEQVNAFGDAMLTVDHIRRIRALLGKE